MYDYYVENPPETGEAFQVYFHHTAADVEYTYPHIHDFIEILYCLRGEYYFKIDKTTTVFRRGMLVVANSNVVHSLFPVASPDGDILAIKLLPEMIYSMYNSSLDMRYAMPFLHSCLKAGYVFGQDEAEALGLKSVLGNMASELREKRYGYEIALKADIYRLLLIIIRQLHETESEATEISRVSVAKIEKALSYIEVNYNKNITVAELANLANSEYCYFSRIFKTLAGYSCTEYINRVRVQKAKQLLLSQDSSITETALLVGYDNTSYFIKQFKRFNCITPKQFILENRSFTG